MSVSISDIQKAKYVILKREDLENLLINVRLETAVDKRVKWIDGQKVKAKYGVTEYWLKKYRKDPFSVLKFKGIGKKQYLEQSIIEEQKRQSEL